MESEDLKAPASVWDLLEQMGYDDPRLQAVSQLLKQQSAPAQAVSAEERTARRTNALVKLQALIGQNRDLAEENQYLRQRLGTLSAALGACACWGEDRGCSCRGDGGPGYFVPDEDAFAAYVRPAVAAMARARRPRETAAPAQRPGKPPSRPGGTAAANSEEP